MTPFKKIWTTSEISEKLATNDNWLTRGILAIYRYQTMDEKEIGTTRHHNAVGFNKPDSHFLCSIARLLERGITLSEKQIWKSRKLMGKYAGQLARIANQAQ